MEEQQHGVMWKGRMILPNHCYRILWRMLSTADLRVVLQHFVFCGEPQEQIKKRGSDL